MTRRKPIVATGIDAIFLLAMRRSWAAGDGRADAVMEMMEICAANMRVVPRVVVSGGES